MEEAVDGEYQTFKSKDGAYVREHFFGKYPETRGDGRRLERRADLGAPPRRPRPAEGLCRLRRRRRRRPAADRDPREDDQGLRHGDGRRGPEHHPPAEVDERRRRGSRSATGSACSSPTRRRRGAFFHRPGRGQPRAPLPARAPRGARRQPARAPRRRRAAADAAAVHDGARGQRRARELHHDGVRPHPQHARPRPRDRRAGRADRARRVTHVRDGGHVPPARDLLPGRPALLARGRRGLHVLPRGRARPDPAGGDQRAGRLLLVDRGGDLVREPRRRDGAVLHLLLDVRVPAGRRPRLGRGRQPRARVPDRRHRGPDDAERRGAAARGRALAPARLGRAQLPRLRPDLRATSSP